MLQFVFQPRVSPCACSETPSVSLLRYKKNLKALYVVHPTNFIKILWTILKPLVRYEPLSAGVSPGSDSPAYLGTQAVLLWGNHPPPGCVGSQG